MNEILAAFGDVLDKNKPYPVSFSVEIDTLIYILIVAFVIILFNKYV